MPVDDSGGKPAAGGALPAGVPDLKLEYAFTVRATLAPPVVIGNGPEGLRRFVPITGGTFAGPLLSGKVVPGSGDWQVVRADGALNAEARYTLEMPDGVLIAVNNRGIRHAPPDIMAKLTRGESVPAGAYYFRTSAMFEAPVGSRYEWVNRTVFVSTAEREPNAAIIHFFRLLQVNRVSRVVITSAVEITVNGKTVSLHLDTRVSLLDLLREQLGLPGTKKGCNQGACGACTVLVNGRRVNACLTLAVMCHGASVTTIEGVSQGQALHPMQEAFVRHDALQCGYCTPGQIMSAIACIGEGRATSADEVREFMSGNLCRCGAYQNIVAAILDVAGASGVGK